MILFKEGVVIKRWTPPIEHLILSLDKLSGTVGFPTDFTVTSINDGLHSKVPLSRHYTDEAIDIRSHDFVSMALKNEFVNRYLHILNTTGLRLSSFFVILEDISQPDEHFHSQVKKNETYP